MRPKIVRPVTFNTQALGSNEIDFLKRLNNGALPSTMSELEHLRHSTPAGSDADELNRIHSRLFGNQFSSGDKVIANGTVRGVQSLGYVGTVATGQNLWDEPAAEQAPLKKVRTLMPQYLLGHHPSGAVTSLVLEAFVDFRKAGFDPVRQTSPSMLLGGPVAIGKDEALLGFRYALREKGEEPVPLVEVDLSQTNDTSGALLFEKDGQLSEASLKKHAEKNPVIVRLRNPGNLLSRAPQFTNTVQQAIDAECGTKENEWKKNIYWVVDIDSPNDSFDELKASMGLPSTFNLAARYQFRRTDLSSTTMFDYGLKTLHKTLEGTPYENFKLVFSDAAKAVLEKALNVPDMPMLLLGPLMKQIVINKFSGSPRLDPAKSIVRFDVANPTMVESIIQKLHQPGPDVGLGQGLLSATVIGKKMTLDEDQVREELETIQEAMKRLSELGILGNQNEPASVLAGLQQAVSVARNTAIFAAEYSLEQRIPPQVFQQVKESLTQSEKLLMQKLKQLEGESKTQPESLLQKIATQFQGNFTQKESSETQVIFESASCLQKISEGLHKVMEQEARESHAGTLVLETLKAKELIDNPIKPDPASQKILKAENVPLVKECLAKLETLNSTLEDFTSRRYIEPATGVKFLSLSNMLKSKVQIGTFHRLYTKLADKEFESSVALLDEIRTDLRNWSETECKELEGEIRDVPDSDVEPLCRFAEVVFNAHKLLNFLAENETDDDDLIGYQIYTTLREYIKNAAPKSPSAT